MDVVLLGSRSGFEGQLLQQGLDGGGDLGHHDEWDEGPGSHLTGPVHG